MRHGVTSTPRTGQSGTGEGIHTSGGEFKRRRLDALEERPGDCRVRVDVVVAVVDQRDSPVEGLDGGGKEFALLGEEGGVLLDGGGESGIGRGLKV